MRFGCHLRQEDLMDNWTQSMWQIDKKYQVHGNKNCQTDEGESKRAGTKTETLESLMVQGEIGAPHHTTYRDTSRSRRKSNCQRQTIMTGHKWHQSCGLEKDRSWSNSSPNVVPGFSSFPRGSR